MIFNGQILRLDTASAADAAGDVSWLQGQALAIPCSVASPPAGESYTSDAAEEKTELKVLILQRDWTNGLAAAGYGPTLPAPGQRMTIVSWESLPQTLRVRQVSGVGNQSGVTAHWALILRSE